MSGSETGRLARLGFDDVEAAARSWARIGGPEDEELLDPDLPRPPTPTWRCACSPTCSLPRRDAADLASGAARRQRAGPLAVPGAGCQRPPSGSTWSATRRTGTSSPTRSSTPCVRLPRGSRRHSRRPPTATSCAGSTADCCCAWRPGTCRLTLRVEDAAAELADLAAGAIEGSPADRCVRAGPSARNLARSASSAWASAEHASSTTSATWTSSSSPSRPTAPTRTPRCAAPRRWRRP